MNFMSFSKRELLREQQKTKCWSGSNYSDLESDMLSNKHNISLDGRQKEN